MRRRAATPPTDPPTRWTPAPADTSRDQPRGSVPMADTVNITRTCGNCRKEITLTVTAAGYRAWDQGRGAYVQVAFPELDPGQRELLVSGICGPCFDEIMVPEPEDDGPGALILIAGDPDDIE